MADRSKQFIGSNSPQDLGDPDAGIAKADRDATGWDLRYRDAEAEDGKRILDRDDSTTDDEVRTGTRGNPEADDPDAPGGPGQAGPTFTEEEANKEQDASGG